MLSKRFALVSVICFLILIAVVPSVVAQQDPPLQIQFALDALSGEVGQTVTLDELRRWEFSQTEYGDTSLGCPQDGQVYAQVVTNGFQFLLSYSALLYDIRVSDDGSIIVICSVVPDSGPTITPGGPTQVPLPTFTPTVPPPLPTLVPTPVDLLTCPALAPRLQAGAQGRVIPDSGLNNNVRSRPGLSGTKIGEILSGGVFTVLSGPICASGFTWWRVNADGLIGWTAEGESGDYFLEPVGAVTPPPAARPDISIFNAAEVRELAQLQGQFTTALDWSPNGTTVALADNGGVLVYDVLALTNPPRRIVTPQPVSSLAFAGDGSQIFVGDITGTVHIIDFASGVIQSSFVAHTAPVSAMTFSPDGLTLVTAKGESVPAGTPNTDSSIKFWTAAGQLSRESTGYTTPVTSIAYSPDALQIASGDTAGAVYILDAVTGAQQFLLQGHTARVNDVAFSLDGRFLASGGDDGVIQLYDVASSATVVGVIGTLTEVSGRAVFSLDFSPDSTLLASAGGALIAPSQDNAVRLWDITGAAAGGVQVVDLLGHTNVVTSVAFSPDGTALASISTDGTARFWGVVELGTGFAELPASG
jgi:hypothetical protein